MGRIRSIKPDFPQSESMGRVSRDARLFFILLWGLVDDSGVARGNSRILASLLFPYDEDSLVVVDKCLRELLGEGCIYQFQHEGSTYISICNWLKHQKIDKPTPSKLPQPNTTLANPRESSRILEKNSLGREEEREEEREGSTEKSSLPSLAVLWNDIVKVPAVVTCNKSRKAKISSRLKELDVSGWKDVFAKIAASEFCAGKNDRGWKATFDWIIENDENHVRVLEGKYDGKVKGSNNGTGYSERDRLLRAIGAAPVGVQLHGPGGDGAGVV